MGPEGDHDERQVGTAATRFVQHLPMTEMDPVEIAYRHD
jgi:hypothetical protein